MILRHLYEESIAQSAYLIGCGETGEALVIDPTIDIGPCVEAATAEGLRIVGVAETHIHADYVSGARALAAAVGGTLYVSGHGGTDWQYAFAGEAGVRVLRHGDVIHIGRLELEACWTPGHTPEHLMYVLTDGRVSRAALGAFSGDFLFVGDVGRPDLLETAAGAVGTMEASARQLFGSMRTVAPYPDYLLIWPGHGIGSACGKDMSGVPVSSLGYERLTNWAVRETDEQAFVTRVLDDQPDPPMYFAEMKRLNRRGASAWSSIPPLRAGDPADLAAAVSAGELLIDIRAGRHEIPSGTIAIPMGRKFATWAGGVVPASTPFSIIADGEPEAEAARRVLALIGRDHAVRWIPPAVLGAYRRNGGEMETVRVVRTPAVGQTPVDVRSTAEWRTGHLEGAVHVPLYRLPEHLDGLDRHRPVVVYCETGVRAAVAATALRRMGFTDVASLEGGFEGYRARQRSANTPANG
jgi:hydroxyacylglutathione hydrolase